MTNFTITLKTLTPIHVGAGEELHHGFDFVVRKKHTWRLDADAILDAKWDRMGLENPRTQSYPILAKVLDKEDFNDRRLFRYRLRGVPHSLRPDARLQAFIKDHRDRPYIPGSSLKGALRTALAWTGWRDVQPRLDRNAIGNRRSWAGQRLERKLFGRDPNHDLLRALQVSDIHGDLIPDQALIVVAAQVLTKQGPQSPVGLEALVSNLTLQGTLRIDDYLFSQQAERVLKFGQRKRWLDELPVRVQAHSKARIAKLEEWFGRVNGAAKVANFYHQLHEFNLPENQALVQIGWGSGWDGKTFWTHLQENAPLFEKLMRDFRLQHRRSRTAPPTRAEEFPTSRRVVTRGGGDRPSIAAPFGWALLELEDAGR